MSRIGENFAAGYFELPDASPMRRWSRAVRRRFERCAPHRYAGELLYPAGVKSVDGRNAIVAPNYSFSFLYRDYVLQERLEDAATEKERETLRRLRRDMQALVKEFDVYRTPHTAGGPGYTHSIPNYGRILRHGLNDTARRIRQGLARARERGDTEMVDFYVALKDVMTGVRSRHRCIVEHFSDLRLSDPEAERRRVRLLAAFSQVPFKPARDFFEAVLAYNFVFYLDDCDNPGRVDWELSDYYDADRRAGRVSHDEAVALMRCFWENADANEGWSVAIGGTAASGAAAYSEMTRICLEATHKIRRPNLQLHIRRDMPAELWDAAFDAIATGCGLPALYNEEEFLRGLREACPDVREEDLGLYSGGGCTETMIHGCSNVGSLDAGINLPLILVDTLDAHLAGAASFEDLMSAYKRDVAAAVAEMVRDVNVDQEVKARLRPQPMRSLLIDDCIDSGREFNAGGARYNWSVVNVAGLANVIDSLAAVREVVFETGEKSGDEFLAILHRNFEGDEALRRRLARCPRFGNDDARADEIARDIADFVFREFLRYTAWRGGKFLASCLMFVIYCNEGKPVGATPDGRRAGEPLADSAGPFQGRDRNGPTAMLKSVAAMPHYLAPGTLCVNARFMKDIFTSRDGREKLRSLIRTYFDLGGMQLQVNVVDQSVLKDAMAHPEEHEDLIVRIGGYSEYFNRLSPELRRTVLERVEHAL